MNVERCLRDKAHWIVMITAFVGMVVLGSITLSIWVNRDKYTDASVPCPSIANLPAQYVARKALYQWHWYYTLNDPVSGYIEQVCPSVRHDVSVYLNNQLLARSDGKIVTAVSTIYINDCHGDRMFVVRTGNIFETALNNGQKIKVSLELKDASGKTLLAYIDGTNFYGNSMTITDAVTGLPSATMTRNKVRVPWEWYFHSLNNSTGSHPAVMMTMVGMQSFSEEDGKTDICNQFFLPAGIIALILLCGLVLAGIILLYQNGTSWLKCSCCRDARQNPLDRMTSIQFS